MAIPLRDVPAKGRLESINPATGEPLGDLPVTSPEEVADAVKRARLAQPSWGSLGARERAKVLRRVRDICIERHDELVRADHTETGKPMFEAGVILLAVADLCNYYASLAVELEKGRKVGVGPLFGKSAHMYFRPLGVAAVISPWNYPFYLAMLQIIPALAAGNAVVHKPSEHTPRVGLLIGEIWHQAGLPEGILQVLIGDSAVGAAILDARVDVISFTGSPGTGRKVMEAAAKHLTPVVLELGGKDAAIICEDADLERAANGVAWGAFVNAGQACIAIKRAIVAAPVYDKFVELLSERARYLYPSGAPDAQYGALTVEHEIARLERQIGAAKRAGARVIAGGERFPGPGVFFPPTILADCTPEMEAVREETFGPLLTVLKAKSDDEAVKLANNSDFGLGGSVWSKNLPRAQKIVARLEVGSCTINDVIVQAINARLPFGGVKHSGIGRAAGEPGYLNYCNVQSVMTSWLTPSRELIWYPYSIEFQKTWKKLIGLYHGSWREKLRRIFR